MSWRLLAKRIVDLAAQDNPERLRHTRNAGHSSSMSTKS